MLLLVHTGSMYMYAEAVTYVPVDRNWTRVLQCILQERKPRNHYNKIRSARRAKPTANRKQPLTNIDRVMKGTATYITYIHTARLKLRRWDMDAMAPDCSSASTVDKITWRTALTIQCCRQTRIRCVWPALVRCACRVPRAVCCGRPPRRLDTMYLIK